MRKKKLLHNNNKHIVVIEILKFLFQILIKIKLHRNKDFYCCKYCLIKRKALPL